MKFLASFEDEGGEAGDTGSAVHSACKAMHTKLGVAESIAAMQRDVHEYPKADLNDAANMFLAYATDVRNTSAEVVLCEERVDFTIAPAPEDPTQEAIVVTGTVDQVRRMNGRLELWDVKSSKKAGDILLQQHVYQIAAYCIGASVLLKERVHPGGLILTRMYQRGKNPLWKFAWGFDDIEQILRPIQHYVAMVRSGRVWHNPNDNCCWCVARTPDVCLPKLKSLL